MSSIVIRRLERDYCIATWDRVLIQIWRRQMTADAVANLVDAMRGFSEEQARAICSVAVIERTSPPPAEEIRSSLSRFYREFAPSLSKAVVVAEGGGFRSALVRGVGLALSMLAPATLPFEFVASVPAAAGVISGHLSPAAGGAAGLERRVEEVRLRLDRQQTNVAELRSVPRR